MAAFFFESSALVKRYVQETGTAWVRSILSPSAANDIHVLRIAEVETVSAVVRRRKGGTLSAADAAAILHQLELDFASDYRVLDISDQLLTSSLALVKKHELRAYDAVQLASALELHRVRTAGGLASATFVSADIELNTAALAEGLTVEDPNAHP